jgi:hypothetical protein
MDAFELEKVAASRERLRRFVDETSNAELLQPIEADWTGAALLAHIAFWDRRNAWLIRRCMQGAALPAEVDTESVNEAALPQWRLIPPRAAAQEALDAAADTDSLLPNLTTEQLTTLRESKVNYDRSNHRNEHVDQIEHALNKIKP